jgi:hypothetical protein
MYMDIQEQFSSGQSLVAGTGDLVSTNVYDSAAGTTPGQNHDEGIGEEIYLNVRVGTAVTAVGGTVQVVLQTDDNVGFATPREFPLTAALAPTALTANTFIVQQRLPIGMERYWRVVYRIAGAAVTVGTADAFMTKDTQASRAYAAGFTVQ